MSRKGSTPQRSVLPDPKHGSETIARFINMVMQSGKKSVDEKIVYGAMDVIGEKNPNTPLLVGNDLAHLMALAGVVEDAFGRGRLAGIDVGHDAEIAVTLDGSGASHGTLSYR